MSALQYGPRIDAQCINDASHTGHGAHQQEQQPEAEYARFGEHDSAREMRERLAAQRKRNAVAEDGGGPGLFEDQSSDACRAGSEELQDSDVVGFLEREVIEHRR